MANTETRFFNPHLHEKPELRRMARLRKAYRNGARSESGVSADKRTEFVINVLLPELYVSEFQDEETGEMLEPQVQLQSPEYYYDAITKLRGEMDRNEITQGPIPDENIQTELRKMFEFRDLVEEKMKKDPLATSGERGGLSVTIPLPQNETVVFMLHTEFPPKGKLQTTYHKKIPYSHGHHSLTDYLVISPETTNTPPVLFKREFRSPYGFNRETFSSLPNPKASPRLTSHEATYMQNLILFYLAS